MGRRRTRGRAGDAALDAYVEAGGLEAGDAMARPSSTVSQPAFETGLGDNRLGVTHQALELLTRRFDVGPVHCVRLPSASRRGGRAGGRAGRP